MLRHALVSESTEMPAPLGSYVLVRPEDRGQAPGGFALPNSVLARRTTGTGVVVAVGPGEVVPDGGPIPVWSSVGSTVSYLRVTAERFDFRETVYALVRDEDVLLTRTPAGSLEMPPGKVLVRLASDEADTAATSSGLFLARGDRGPSASSVGEVVAVGSMEPLSEAPKVAEMVQFRAGIDVYPDLEDVVRQEAYQVVDASRCSVRWRRASV